MPAVTAMASETAPMSIVVKGKELNTPNKPILKNGQNFSGAEGYSECGLGNRQMG
ncbi:hypothetical protein ACFSQ7_47390 [Paenibacillus rhizoplanae]